MPQLTYPTTEHACPKCGRAAGQPCRRGRSGNATVLCSTRPRPQASLVEILKAARRPPRVKSASEQRSAEKRIAKLKERFGEDYVGR